ncbi:MAG: Re/Si-specific NAD(P)(+) transhydrogenase subunit alpha [Myxococcales bacterium]|nr:Re/Si-specific NAD(P)(+) transhydrogenase subunit alpha [Myxococcales bacterium]
MPLGIALLKEVTSGEARVALVPESVKRLAKSFAVRVQAGAGVRAGFSDEEYRRAGAELAADPAGALAGATLVMKIHPPTTEEIALLAEGQAVASLLFPLTQLALVRALAGRKVTALALDQIPRTTLAQMMDVLSSQATIAGYRAVILAAERLPRLFPMMMTAAGTLPPARVLVMGAGVAGLQAIATARRLGAMVEAFDVRKVAKEQVESLGAKFVEVAGDDAQTAGGYATEVGAEYQQQQAALVHERIGKADVVITTALVPGRRAPVLVTAEHVSAMRPGSVLVDLAADQGGNCALSRPGETFVTDGGVSIVAPRNVPGAMPVHASLMWSKNMEKLIAHLTDKDGALKLDTSDEIVRGLLITRGGEVVHEGAAAALAKEVTA